MVRNPVQATKQSMQCRNAASQSEVSGAELHRSSLIGSKSNIANEELGVACFPSAPRPTGWGYLGMHLGGFRGLRHVVFRSPSGRVRLTARDICGESRP